MVLIKRRRRIIRPHIIRNYIVTIVFISIMSGNNIWAQYNGMGRPIDDYDEEAEEGLSNEAFWLLVLSFIIAYQLWKRLLKKDNQEDSDGCLPIGIIAILIGALYLIIKHKII